MENQYFQGFEGETVMVLAEKINRHMKEHNLQILQVTYQVFGYAFSFGTPNVKHYALAEFTDKIENL